jgi:predicted alpha/beta-fold hydrolase
MSRADPPALPDGATPPVTPQAQKEAALQQLALHPFRAAWWARSGFAQTVVTTFQGAARADLRLERWSLPDGDFVRLHFAAGARGAPLVLLLHGLEGSRESPYAGAMHRLVQAQGWQFVVLEFRSCGGELNHARRTYHSGETSDLDFVVERLCVLDPGRPIFVVGFSLGANVLLKWLGECGERVPEQVVAAAAVSPPFDLEAAARQCDERYGGLITRQFLSTLIPKALAKAKQFPGLLEPRAVRACRTFAAFDDLVTAPLHGFRDALHYWRSSSCAHFLPAIRRPTLLVASRDDPLIPGRVLPHDAVAASPWLAALFTKRGGHVGFVAGGSPWRPRRWAEAQVQRFFVLHERWRAATSATAGSP